MLRLLCVAVDGSNGSARAGAQAPAARRRAAAQLCRYTGASERTPSWCFDLTVCISLHTGRARIRSRVAVAIYPGVLVLQAGD